MKDLLLDYNVNPASIIEYEINNKVYKLTLEEIIDAYVASNSSSMFKTSLDKVIRSNPANIKQYFEQMGKLLLMANLSDNIDAFKKGF